MPMTYDYFGAFAPAGPTAPHSPLTSYSGIPRRVSGSAAAIDKLIGTGVPAEQALLGIGFYGRGWTGVTQSAPGGSATGAAPGTYEEGIEDYKVLKRRARRPAPWRHGLRPLRLRVVELRHPEHDRGEDGLGQDPGTGRHFFWELSGDTSNGELVTSVANGLK